MKIVVDTNIIFSAILNINGKIGDLLLNSSDIFTFYTCDFLKEELEEHHEKLKKISKLTDEQIKTSKEIIFSHITFFKTEILPDEILLDTFQIMQDIDPDDTEFVALARVLNAKLWTGDKKLINGLFNKNINLSLTTDELYTLRSSFSQ